ncbi:phage tail assembly chaperone [Pseudomonas chlororaphis]|uniref:phage tail assembly chaperone n=1 Tax=Pseudomonas chlororaphis TaxID=587753 RepID=UPI0013DE2EAD|nr:phage tail assembly chaperone [Pseudomonas chlororaphis]
MYYSESTGGFYDAEIHNGNIPNDSVVLSKEEYEGLMSGQCSGLEIYFDKESGKPALRVRPAPTREELAISEKIWREDELLKTDSVVARHRDEAESGEETTLTAAQYQELQRYRKNLRNWPEMTGFPDANLRPQSPAWLA